MTISKISANVKRGGGGGGGGGNFFAPFGGGADEGAPQFCCLNYVDTNQHCAYGIGKTCCGMSFVPLNVFGSSGICCNSTDGCTQPGPGVTPHCNAAAVSWKNVIMTGERDVSQCTHDACEHNRPRASINLRIRFAISADVAMPLQPRSQGRDAVEAPASAGQFFADGVRHRQQSQSTPLRLANGSCNSNRR